MNASAAQAKVDESTVANFESRYRDAYRVANLTITFGNLIKWAGTVFALFVGWTFSSFGSPMGRDGGAALVGAIFAAGMVVLLAFAAGTFICAHGQELMATLDTAVYASPFLPDDSKLSVIGARKKLPEISYW